MQKFEANKRSRADDYSTLTRLGQGACGAVYLVRHNSTKKLFAWKQIALDENRKTRTKAAVQKEASILAKLKHPNIVSFCDSFFDLKEENLIIIQDYCDSGTLEDKINEAAKSKQYFSEKQIVQWFVQITMSVEYIHSCKVLHRDLKAANVFLTKTGQTPKLGDFGISRMMDATVDMASTCVGTPCYLAPEMCQNIPYTSKADVWALGCLLYEMCALRPAFDANNLISLFFKIVKEEYEPIPGNYSEDLARVIKVLLVKSADERPSAYQLLRLPYLSQSLHSFIQETEYQLQTRQKETPQPITTSMSPAITRRSRSTQPPKLQQTAHVSGKSSLSRSCDVNIKVTDKDMMRSDSGLGETPDVGPAVHADEPPCHTCKECGKTFRLHSWLVKHRAGHRLQYNQPTVPLNETSNDITIPSLDDSGTDTCHQMTPAVTEYDDDFEDYPQDDDDSSASEDNDDIPEDLPGGQTAADNSDTDEPEEEDEPLDRYEDDEHHNEYAEHDEEYADDFEDEEEELGALVERAREIQQRDEVLDHTVADEAPSQQVSTYANLLKRQCEAAVGQERYQQLIHGGAPRKSLTSEDLRLQVSRSSGADHMETCYLITEILKCNLNPP